MLIEEFIKTTLAAFIITFTWAVAGTAMAGEIRMSGAVWLWSEAAPMSGETAKALGDGQIVRGIRLAQAALQRAETDQDRLIAHHNLCIVHAARGRMEAATGHCEAARQLVRDSYVVASEDDALRLERPERSYNSMITAVDVLEANLSRLGLQHLGKELAVN